jgi:hypothetical protein
MSLLIPLAVALGLGVSHAETNPPPTLVDLRLNVDVQAPRGWVIEAQSNEQVVAKSADGRSTAWVAVGSFQVPVHAETANDAGQRLVNRLHAVGYDNVTVTQTSVVPVAGRDGAAVRAEGRADGKPDFVSHLRSWPIEGAMVHVGVRGPLEDEAKLQKALDAWLGSVSGGGEPADLAALAGTVQGENGVGAALAPGWRRAQTPELAALQPVLKNMGLEKLDPALCWAAIRPDIVDHTDVAIACHRDLQIGILNASSSSLEDESVRTQLFGSKAADKAAAQVIEGSDRLTLLYDMPSDATHDADMAVTPYGTGALITYAIVETGGGDTARGIIEPIVASATFPGDDNGLPSHGAASWIGYVMRVHPFALGIAFLPFMAGAVVWFKRGAEQQRRAREERGF